jgi:hypothetical protein
MFCVFLSGLTVTNTKLQSIGLLGHILCVFFAFRYYCYEKSDAGLGGLNPAIQGGKVGE